jgi:pyruvate dehydrogenase E2 component (dihydrolipoamide acetyltransferase)
LHERGVDARQVRGTGRDGRVTPDDVRSSAAGRIGADERSPSAAGMPLAGREPRRLSPLVRRLLRERDVDARQVTGSGRAGRVTPEDVRSFVEPAPGSGSDLAVGDGSDRTRTEPLSRTRRIIARRMHDSLVTTAQLTSAVEADVTQIMTLRGQIGEAARAALGTSISPLAFIAHATARTLLAHPLLNASMDLEAGTCTFHAHVDLGIAVDTPNGLVVPVLRDAAQSDPLTLQAQIRAVATRARERRLTPDDLAGGTFTLTNTGAAGSLFDTPILNPPQVAILATPKIERRPVVISDEYGDHVAIRERTYLCLTYDHRLVDGADAARFLTDLKAALDTTSWGPEIDALRG